MNRIVTSTIALVALTTPLFAAECPEDKRVYTFEKTGESFNIGMPPSKSFVLGDAGISELLARYKIGEGAVPAISASHVSSKPDALPVMSPFGSFFRLGDLGPKDSLTGGDMPVFKGSYTCKK